MKIWALERFQKTPFDALIIVNQFDGKVIELLVEKNIPFQSFFNLPGV